MQIKDIINCNIFSLYFIIFILQEIKNKNKIFIENNIFVQQ